MNKLAFYQGYNDKEPVKHTFVTGHSGAGKSTLSKALAEQEGIKRVGLDKHPSILKF